MGRPEKVDQAISVEADDTVVGMYDLYRLRSAYLPLYRFEDGLLRMEAVEGLLRTQYKNEWISPIHFLPHVPEEDGHFVEWLSRALHIHNFHRGANEGLDLYVNLDPSLFKDRSTAIHELDVMLERTMSLPLDPARLVVEIVETPAASAFLLQQMIDFLRQNKVRVAVDDYGTNCSTAERVAFLDPDIVKLDRMVVANALQTPDGRRTIAELVKSLRGDGKDVVYEGVETQDQLLFARETGIPMVQGFLFGQPTLAPLVWPERVLDPDKLADAA